MYNARGRGAVAQVLACEQQLAADARAVALVTGERFRAQCARLKVHGEFRSIGPGQANQEAILNAFQSDLVVAGHPEPHGLPPHMMPERILLESGGPLLIIPGSHKRGHFHNPDAMDIDDEIIAILAAEKGIEPVMGPPGTVVFFDALSVHGSAANISPWPRRIFYLNYNAVSNRQILPLREPFHCSVDLTPISVLADDCLLQREASA